MIFRLMMWWESIKDWFNFDPCPKEQMGYNCRHQVMSNGQLECGKETNYWGGP